MSNPIPSALAARWRSVWHPNAFLPRPWWRFSSETPRSLERVDGWCVHDTFTGMSVQPPGLGETQYLAVGTGLADAVAFVDASHPIPAPEPMPGQVWASGGGTECMIAAAWRDGGSWLVQWASNDREPRLWVPPTTSVLVSGPTPWGRDVPWAPMGGGAS